MAIIDTCWGLIHYLFSLLMLNLTLLMLTLTRLVRPLPARSPMKLTRPHVCVPSPSIRSNYTAPTGVQRPPAGSGSSGAGGSAAAARLPSGASEVGLVDSTPNWDDYMTPGRAMGPWLGVWVDGCTEVGG